MGKITGLIILLTINSALAEEGEPWVTWGDDAQQQIDNNQGFYDYRVETDLNGDPWTVEFENKEGQDDE